MASGSNATRNGAHVRKRMAELKENYRLQHVEIELLRAELAMLKESNQILSNLNSNLQEREGGCVRAVAEKEQRLSEALELVESLKKEVSELENVKLSKELMECKHEIHPLCKSEKEQFIRKLAEKELELKANAQAMQVMKKMNSDLKVENKKLMATMQQLKMKFHQLYKENRKIPELSAEVDRLRQQLSHGRKETVMKTLGQFHQQLLKEDDMAS